MARILPQGANVNLQTENPMDRLMKLIQTASSVQNIFAQGRQQQQLNEREALASLTVVSNLIGQSDDPSDIDYAENIYNAIDHTGSGAYDSTYKAVGKSISDTKQSYSQIQSIGDEVASFVTQNVKIYDADGNVTTDKRFSDLNKDEIISYFNQIRSKDGANGEIAKQLGKVKQFRLALANRFGMTADGQLKKMPNINFKDNFGSDMSSSEFLVNLDRFQNQMNIFVEAGFEDGILNEQEAIMVLNGDYNNYLKRRAEKKEIFRLQATQTNSNINDANTKIKSIISATKDNDWTSALSNPQLMQTIMSDISNPDVQMMYAEQFAGSPSPTEDPELNAKMIYNDMGARSKAEILEFYNKRKRGLETQRQLNKTASESWGFNFYGEPPPPSVFAGLQDDTQTSKAGDFDVSGIRETLAAGLNIPTIKAGLHTVKEFNFDKPITSPEGEDISKGDQAGTTAIVSGVLKKYENINKETNKPLVEANNLYAIKFGDRAKKYGATDSGITATDGGTFAKWGSVEEMEKNAPKIIAEMLNDDAEGDLKRFIGNYIGATENNPKTDEINTRYNEIVKASTETKGADIKPEDKIFSPFEGKTITIDDETIDTLSPKELSAANKMFENYQSKSKRYVSKLEQDLKSKEKRLAMINKNITETYSRKKQKEARKNKLKLEDQIKNLKTKISNQKEFNKKNNINTWYNSIMTNLQKNRIIEIGAGDPMRREADEDYYRRGIATTQGLPDIPEDILEQLFNELRPGSPLKRY